MAERGGFEPPKRGLDAYTLSRRAPSTTRTSLRAHRRRHPAVDGEQAILRRFPGRGKAGDGCRAAWRGGAAAGYGIIAR